MRRNRLLPRLVLLFLAAQFALAAVTYIYDSAGRVVKADYGSAGALIYTYDKAGRLISRQMQVLSCDVNGDQATNVVDMQIMIGEALGMIPPINDLNVDSVVNVADVQIVITAALGKGCAVK